MSYVRHHLRSGVALRRDVFPVLDQREIAPLESVVAGRAGLIVVDGGANVGAWSAAWLARFGAQTRKILAFEPQSLGRVHTPDRDLFRAQDLVKLHGRRAALWRDTGTQYLFTDTAGSTLASLFPGPGSKWGPPLAFCERVPTISIDDMMAAEGIQRIDVLKLDVEGAELAALQGARRALDNGLIHSILFEFGAPHAFAGVHFADLFGLLIGARFQISAIDDDGSLIPIDAYSTKYEVFESVAYYLAIKTPRSSLPPC